VSQNLSALAVLLRAQRHHWIDPGGASRRQETRRRRDGRQESCNSQIYERIKRIDLEENLFERAGGDDPEKESSESNPKGEPNDQLEGSLAHHHFEDAGRVRAERHANSEFLRALID